jgi:hypothetical protein
VEHVPLVLADLVEVLFDQNQSRFERIFSHVGIRDLVNLFLDRSDLGTTHAAFPKDARPVLREHEKDGDGKQKHHAQPLDGHFQAMVRADDDWLAHRLAAVSDYAGVGHPFAL